ncbi:hypothetical protein F0U60_06235 [Archangium minus]|uniref:Uncharacterized protein n=1 Tax=Archangium minus TaxID=83450 RepID=A0ABY9WLR3_9BACT|nr:hypothetical protein F0U60_06235 [Archangium minus]
MAEDSLQGPITAPERAQGMTVVDDAILFTTGKQELIHLPFDAENFTAPLGGGTDPEWRLEHMTCGTGWCCPQEESLPSTVSPG